jgi:enolase
VAATCELEGGATAAASVPSGASTGSGEALELRDGDATRYRGMGCRKAAANVNGEIAAAVIGPRFEHQSELDWTLVRLDGTGNKSRLGANAILATSLAFARACAVDRRVPLYQYFADMIGNRLRGMPRLTVNLFSGGKHAGGQVPVQDVLVVPVAATTIDRGLAMTFDVYQSAAELSLKKYGMRALKADEGGLAPPFPDVTTALADAVESIRAAGYVPGDEVALAIDVAASHFYRDGRYHLASTRSLPGPDMIGQVRQWTDQFPIISVEDGLAEDDWTHWPALRDELAARSVLAVGDDLLCTNPARITRAIDSRAADTLLLKVNQIGTLSEAADAMKLARDAGWRIVVSARSGETEDNWLADLAVGWGGDFIKVGSIAQSERLSKYNRLLEIEAVM